MIQKRNLPNAVNMYICHQTQFLYNQFLYRSYWCS